MSKQIIKLKIHEESDLFSSFDPDQKMLSEDISVYLAHNYLNKHRKIDEEYTLRIISDTPVDQEKVKERIREYYSQEKNNVKYILKRLTFKEICLFILGAIVLGIWLLLSADKSNVNLEILSIIGWVAIWEATSIAIMERPEIHHASRAFDRVIQADYVFEIAES